MIAEKAYTVTSETLESIDSYRCDSGNPFKWECLFVLPFWLKVWWDHFGTDRVSYICAVRRADDLIGIAPLMLKGETAFLMGDTDVCDYLDFIVVCGREIEFFGVLVEHLRQQGISRLDLRPLRPDSTVIAAFAEMAESLNCEITCKPENVALELDLPATWDDFLQRLSGKQRHEIRRKFRRLQETARINYRVVADGDEVKEAMGIFLALFKKNRMDKAAFMTHQMASFFRSVAQSLAKEKMLKIFFLEVDKAPAAAVMCFDYHSNMFLYNSGYDSRFGSLSVGLLSKVLSIKNSIERGKKRYDFMKGAESYKKRLGGKSVPLYRCQVEIK